MPTPLVLGAVRGYRAAQLAPFVTSLRATGYAGEVALADFGIDADTRADLARAGVEVFALADPRLADLGFLDVSVGRYLAYRDLLEAHPDRWDRLLLTDVRDVVFQADPFAADTGPGLACFLEDERIVLGGQEHNSRWIRECYGDEGLERIGALPISCSGTTAGTAGAVRQYLELMCAEILRIRAGKAVGFGIDQAIHNHLLWSRQLDDVVVFPNGRGNVLTLGIAPEDEVRFDAEGRLRNADGTLPAVVHQYDRVPLLARLLLARFAGAPAGGPPAARPGPAGSPPAHVRSPGGPEVSVVVPTYGRPDRIARLLERLRDQTVAADRFEVVVVDDGTPDPIALDAAAFPYPLALVRQENAGPAAARNAGVSRSRAPLVLFLNDDAVPDPNLLAVHLDAHRRASGPLAVMGAFPFTRKALREPFTRLLAGSSLLFDFPGLRGGALHDWTFFWTCNLSLPKEVLEAAGGFDGQTFREAIVEDVELGYRLQQRGLRTLYREDAVCEHEHALTVDDYFRRMVRLGVNQVRMWRKHGDATVLGQPPGTRIERDLLLRAQQTFEQGAPKEEAFLQTVRRWSEAYRNGTIPPADRERLQQAVRQASHVPYARGIVMELAGHDPARAIAEGPPRGQLTSIVACSYNALAKTRAFVESVRVSADPAFPTELVFTDNGSTDGSAEWLAAQPDVRLVRNAGNEGAPRARNQALALARGANVLFADNDIVVGPGWLERMLYHLAVDPRAGCVGACADRASHGQQVDYGGPTDPASLARFAEARALENHRAFQPASALASFCLLVRGEVIERIGGFDERFSPWGFEDDDYTLRAWFAGWHNRIALDVFVHHDTYDGPKLDRHLALLEANWRRFAEKWGLGTAAYGDFSGLERRERAGFSEADLLVPCPKVEGPGLRCA